MNYSNALYFPAISLPKESAIASAILYWDKLYSVVPFSHVENPDERLSPFMQELSRECDVNHIVPYLHLHEIPDFDHLFIDFLGRVSKDNPECFQESKTVRIHAEKLLEVPKYLVDNGLASGDGGEWYQVNAVVADYFMAYLALTLGNLSSINATPFTTNQHLAKMLGGVEKELQSIDAIRWQERIRLAVLPEVEIEGLDLARLMAFKRDHSKSAHQLRNEAEKMLGKVLGQESDELREEAFRDQLSQFNRKVDCFKREAAHYHIKISSTAIMPTAGAGLSFAGSLDGNSVGAAGAALSFLALVSDAVRSMNKSSKIARDYGSAVTFVAGIEREFCRPGKRQPNCP